MTKKLQFSLRTMLAAAAVVALILGWAADHRYLARDARAARAVERLRSAVEQARSATDHEHYGRASEAGVNALWDLHRNGPDAFLAPGAYIEAIMTPDRFYGSTDYSLSLEAAPALAALGSISKPIALGLLHDDKAHIRHRALDVLEYSIGMVPDSRVTPLPLNDIRLLVHPIREARERETDKVLKRRMESILTHLKGQTSPGKS